MACLGGARGLAPLKFPKIVNTSPIQFLFFFISLELVPPPSTTDLKQPIVVLLFQHTQNFIKSFHTQKPYSNLLSLTG